MELAQINFDQREPEDKAREEARNEVRHYIENSRSFVLKEIKVEELQDADLAFFERFLDGALTLEDIEKQKYMLEGYSSMYFEKARRIMNDVQNGLIPKINNSEELKIFSKIKTEKIKPEDLEKEERALKEKRKALSASLGLLSHIEEVLRLQRQKAS